LALKSIYLFKISIILQVTIPAFIRKKKGGGEGVVYSFFFLSTKSEETQYAVSVEFPTHDTVLNKLLKGITDS